ncbi:hybrid sensor histidine kinase/response regulator [Endothiovibrio diazotrophicus]
MDAAASPPLRLLLIEDSADDEMILIYSLLDAGFSVEHRRVQNEAELRDALNEGNWQAVFSDHCLPGFDGFKALKIVREWSEHVPFFLVSGTVQDDVGARAMEQGANDYLLKDNLARLGPALARELEEANNRRNERITTAQYKNILDNATDAIVSIDPDSRIVLFNRGAEKTFGYTADEVLGADLNLLLPMRFAAVHQRYVDAVADGGSVCRAARDRQAIDFVGRRKDGGEFPAEINISRTVTEGGTTFTAIVRDVSERKALERKLKRHNEALESRVAERTAELEQARQEAQHLAQTKSEFLANMSHEIRTPMNAVLGLAYMLKQIDLPDAAADLARKIYTSGESLLAILNDILDLSKLEAGKLQIDKEPFHLADVLDNLSTIMMTAATGKGLDLIITPPPFDSGLLVGDALRIGQVLVNLTSNAIKFTDSGFVEVKIELLEKRNGNARLRFSVLDTGIGLDHEAQGRIFNAFTQADATTTRRFGGTGLGLAITRHLVSLMGGELSVSSKPGQGSTFHFSIELPCQEDPSRLVKETPDRKVLVVDDSPVSLHGLGATIRSIGWNAELFGGGRDLVERILCDDSLQTSRTVLLIDWLMPDMDGLEVVLALTDLLPRPRLPILFMITAHGVEEIRSLPGSERVDAILSKPLGPSALHNAVRSAQKRRLDRTIAHPPPPTGPARLSGLRMLIVDDSEINREVAELIFRNEGAEIHTAADGQSAIDWLRRHPTTADLVLMDVHMPVMDGLEATRRIRNIPQLAGLPIVAITAGALKEQQESALAAGMSDFIPKPFVVDSAVSQIRSLIGRDPLERPATQGTPPPPSPSPTPTPTPTPDSGRMLNEAFGLAVFKSGDTYHRYLHLFLEQYRPSAGVLDEPAAEDGPLGELIHKLRGSAANLGLERLASAAGAADAAIKQGACREAELEMLRNEFAATCQAIDAYLPARDDEEKAPRAEEADREAIAPLIAEALAGVAAHDPSAVEPPLDRLSRHLPSGRLASIEKALARFRFSEVKEGIRELAAELDIPLEE